MMIMNSSPMLNQADDFQRAAANAEAEAGLDWWRMTTSAQAASIYKQLRRIDANRAAQSATDRGRPHPGVAVATGLGLVDK